MSAYLSHRVLVDADASLLTNPLCEVGIAAQALLERVVSILLHFLHSGSFEHSLVPGINVRKLRLH